MEHKLTKFEQETFHEADMDEAKTIFDEMIRSTDAVEPVFVRDPIHNDFTIFAKPATAPSMHVDLVEHTNFYAFHADMPGYKKENIHVVMDGDILMVEAHRDAPVLTDVKSIHQERTVGRMSRSFRLPKNAITEPMPSAKYINGVLIIMFEKKKEEEASADRVKLAIK